MDENKIRVIIVEDDDIIRESFAVLLSDSDELCCIGDYRDCETAIDDLSNKNPDIILMDISLPGISGIEGIKKIKKLKPSIEIVAITVHENDKMVFNALCAGACGYLTKNVPPQKIVDAVKEAYNGGSPMSTNIARMVVQSFHKSNDSPLSPRETEVLQHLSYGKSYTMIAAELFIDKETVRSHIKNIYQKLEVHSKADALEKASRKKLI